MKSELILRRLLLTVILLSLPALAQNVRWDPPTDATAITTQGTGFPFLVALPNVTVNFCTYPANAAPCTNFATTFNGVSGSSCPNNQQVTLPTSSSCQATSDNAGNWGVYVPAGTYAYTFTSGTTTYGPYVASVSGNPGILSAAVSSNSSGTFVTTPTPPAGPAGGFGYGNMPCSSFDPALLIDSACADTTNTIAFLTQTPNSFRHGVNFYFQTDTKQANNPIAWTDTCGVETPSSGQVANDVWCRQVNAFVGGGNTYTGNLRGGKIRMGLVGSGTTMVGNLYGQTVYVPTFSAGTSFTGALQGWGCDAPSVVGSVTGGYVCFNGGTVIGQSLTFGTKNPAFGINTGAGATYDAYCWGTLSGTNIFTSANCDAAASGAPNGALTDGIGSLYRDTTNGNLWLKQIGVGNTGWVQVGGSANGQADPSFGSVQTNSVAGCQTSFGITPVNTGSATTTTGQNCLPANSVIDAVVYRITTTITTAVNFTVGRSGSTALYCSTQSTLTIGTTGICFAQTGSSGAIQASAVPVLVTFNTTPGAGAMRLIVYYHTWTPPTS